MMSVLIAIRDALIVLALSWVGVTLERSAAEAPKTEPAAAASNVDGAAPSRPAFSNLNCPDR